MFIEIIKKIPPELEIFGNKVEAYSTGTVIGLRNGIASELCKMKLAKEHDPLTATPKPLAPSGGFGQKRKAESDGEPTG